MLHWKAGPSTKATARAPRLIRWAVPRRARTAWSTNTYPSDASSGSALDKSPTTANGTPKPSSARAVAGDTTPSATTASNYRLLAFSSNSRARARPSAPREWGLKAEPDAAKARWTAAILAHPRSIVLADNVGLNFYATRSGELAGATAQIIKTRGQAVD